MREDTNNIVDLNGWKVLKGEAIKCMKKFITEKEYKLDTMNGESLEKVFNGLNQTLQQSILYEIRSKPKNDEGDIFQDLSDTNILENVKKIQWELEINVNKLVACTEEIHKIHFEILALEEKIREADFVLDKKLQEEEAISKGVAADNQAAKRLEDEKRILMEAMARDYELQKQQYEEARRKFEELKSQYNQLLMLMSEAILDDLRKMECCQNMSDEQLREFAAKLFHSENERYYQHAQKVKELEEAISNAHKQMQNNSNKNSYTAGFQAKQAGHKKFNYDGKMYTLNALENMLAKEKSDYIKNKGDNIRNVCKEFNISPSDAEIQKLASLADDTRNSYGANNVFAELEKQKARMLNCFKTQEQTQKELGSLNEKTPVSEDFNLDNLDLDLSGEPSDDFGDLDIGLMDPPDDLDGLNDSFLFENKNSANIQQPETHVPSSQEQTHDKEKSSTRMKF